MTLDNRELKTRIARLFYDHRLTKTEIGKKLRVSRFKVARYLDEALEEGLVDIKINKSSYGAGELEGILEQKFGIKQARIVMASLDHGQNKKNIGRAAAGLLEEILHNGDTIGVAWGTTLYEMLNSLAPGSIFRNISVVQLTGGLHQVEKDYSPVELTRRMAKIFGAEVYQLYVPTIVDRPGAMEILIDDINIKRTIEMFEKIDIALVGIGSVSPRPSTMLYRDGYINQNDVESIINSGAVGDINSYFYDRDGNRCSTVLDGRTIGIGLEQLRKVPYTMGVAGGDEKAEAIYGALKGGIINIIVTDTAAAEKILSMDGEY